MDDSQWQVSPLQLTAFAALCLVCAIAALRLSPATDGLSWAVAPALAASVAGGFDLGRSDPITAVGSAVAALVVTSMFMALCLIVSFFAGPGLILGPD